MIQVRSKISLQAVQNLFAELESLSLRGESIDISMPKEISGFDFGVLFSFIQFFATWVRNPLSGNLRLQISDSEIEQFLSTEYGYPIVALAWEKQILNARDENIRFLLKEPSQAVFKRMEFFELPERNAAPVYCFDHDKNKRGHSRIFYSRNLELYPEGVMGINLTPAFVKIGSFSKEIFRQNLSATLDELFAIIHELFGNTDEHAKTSAEGYNLYPNVRGVYLKFHKRKLETYRSQYKEFIGLRSFFESDFNVNSTGELYLIELSVLDSGPGLVRRYMKSRELNMTVNQEVAIVKECLIRHNTSASGLKQTVKGIGLDRVLRTLDGKGFLRIRTGKVDVYRDLRNAVYSPAEQSNEIQLNDWNSGSTENYSTQALTEGTLISIFYPLDYNL